MKRIVLAAATVALWIGAACSDNSPSAPIEPASLPPDGLIVSNAQPDDNGFAYVSASPATFPATSVTIRNVTRSGPDQSIAVINGGFDPVGIAAGVGDEISLLFDANAAAPPLLAKVPAARSPRIVRTNPSNGSVNVAIDAPVLMVFSEPVDRMSVTGGSIALVRSGNPTAGHVRVSADGLSAQFVSDEPFQSQTDYALVVDGEIRDLDGSNLGATVSASFRTVTLPVVEGVGTIATTAITTLTAGSEIDPDGYAVSIDGQMPQHVDVTGTVVVSGVKRGAHTVALSGLTGNCGLADGPVQQATVIANVTTSIAFNVVCAQLPPVTGRLAFVSGRDGNSEIYAINADGTDRVRLTTNAATDDQPAWSPDGRKIAFVSNRDAGATTQSSDIYIMDADGSNVVRLTFGTYSSGPSWSPDGRRIAFSAIRNGDFGIYTMGVGGLTAETNVGHPRGYQTDPAWSPDGSKIAFTSDWRAFDFVYDVYVGKPDGSGISILFEGPFFAIDGEQYFFQPAWSPDGRKIAVVVCAYAWDNCYPNSTVTVANADGTASRSLVQTGGFARPAWSPDGSVIAFGTKTCRGCESALRYMWVATGQSGVITSNGHSPTWQP